MSFLYATCVEFDGRGILLCGPSGSGKSDLALRLIEAGGTLVADDQVVLEVRDNQLFASAPPSLKGQLEIRGLGIRMFPAADAVPVALVAELVPPGEIERLPETRAMRLNEVAVPSICLYGLEASAVAKIRCALAQPPAARPTPAEPCP